MAVFLYACVRAREKVKKCVFFQMCDAIKHRNFAFKHIFSPVERVKTENGIVTRLVQNKRSDGLKNAFCIF